MARSDAAAGGGADSRTSVSPAHKSMQRAAFGLDDDFIASVALFKVSKRTEDRRRSERQI